MEPFIPEVGSVPQQAGTPTDEVYHVLSIKPSSTDLHSAMPRLGCNSWEAQAGFNGATLESPFESDLGRQPLDPNSDLRSRGTAQNQPPARPRKETKPPPCWRAAESLSPTISSVEGPQDSCERTGLHQAAGAGSEALPPVTNHTKADFPHRQRSPPSDGG